MNIEDKKLLITLGERIKILRNERNLTQEQVAGSINMDRTYFSDVERGKRNVAAVNLIKIAKALEVSVGDFFEN